VTDRMCVFGVPGSGKTTFAIDYCKDWLRRSGGAPDEIAYLAFTRAAANEAADRILRDHDLAHWTEESFRGFRTIHSWCLGLMSSQQGHGAGRDRPQVMQIAHWKEFAKQTGMTGSYAVSKWDDVGEVLLQLGQRGKSVWDKCRAAYSMTRISCRSPSELELARSAPKPSVCRVVGLINPEPYRVFVKAYERFKEREGLIDFTDMLEFGLANPSTMGARLLVVDEAQDLYPLAWAVIRACFDGQVDELLLAGDDDQVLYEWSQVRVEDFLDEARRSTIVVRDKTFRFGPLIVDFAGRIIRKVKTRQPKDIIPAEERQNTISQTFHFAPQADPHNRTCFILHRHVNGCQELASRFILDGIPFRNERGKDPLGATQRLQAYYTAVDLAAGHRVQMYDVGMLMRELLPSIQIDLATNQARRLVVHGGKKKVSESSGTVDIVELVQMGILTEDGARVIEGLDVAAMKHSDDLAYYQRLHKNGYGPQSAAPIITTIHGSKGRQAQRVVVFSEMGAKCWENNIDAEHRAAYVACTRTQGELVICHERLLDWAKTRYSYPFDEEADNAGKRRHQVINEDPDGLYGSEESSGHDAEGPGGNGQGSSS